MNLDVNSSKHQNICWNPSLADVDNEFFSERLDHFSLAKSAQHQVQTSKKINKQTKYQNIEV